MKTKKKNVGIVLTTFLISLFLTTACTSTNTTKSGNNSTHKKNPIVKNSLTIVAATAEQDGQWILVETKMKNNTTSAQNLKPDLLALVSNSTILSPDANSEIPQQIPAKTAAEFKIRFDPKSLVGDVPLRLAYQPIDHSKPEQFFTIGKLTIKKAVASEQPKSNVQSDSAGQPSSVQQPNPSKLELQSQTLNNVVTVQVPVGWIKTPNNGGDFGGFQYFNPKDANQQMLVIYSSCAGCGYANSNPDTDTPDPVSLIDQEYIIKSNVIQNGLSAGYSYYLNGNSNIGNGVVKMKRGEGYAFVEIVLPESEKAAATQVLNSFQFLGFH